MICPKCKSEITDNALRCPICNTKVKMFCPNCHSLIKFGLAYCNVCHFEILKKCKNCNAVNLATENICRKCKKPINIIIQDKTANINNQLTPTKPESNNDETDNTVVNKEEDKININPTEIFEMNVAENIDISKIDEGIKTHEKELNIKYYEQATAQDRAYSALKDDKKIIVALSGEDGFGKTTILSQIINLLNKDNICVFNCECSANTQLLPFGAIQTSLRRFLQLPEFYANKDIFELNIKPAICNTFNFLTKSEQNYLCNLLYPTDQSYYENILLNQNNTYEILNKIIRTISDSTQIVFVVDDFDLIDAASYKYLMSLIKENLLSKQVKILVAYKENVHVQSYLNFVNTNENVYENIFLGHLTDNNVDELVKFFLDGQNPIIDSVKKQIIKNSNYNAGYIEQAVFYLNDLGAFIVENDTIQYSTSAYEVQLPETYEKIVAERVNNLKLNSIQHYEFLINSALLGKIFNAQIVQSVMNLPDDATNNIINFLINAGYILPYQHSDLTFRNNKFWQCIYDIAKKDEKFIDYNKKIHNLLSSLEYYNLSIKALFAQSIDENFLAFNLWTQNIKIASAVGDIDLYVLAQKQCLKLLSDFTHTNSEYIKNNINERIGKLTYKSNPIEATSYLTDAMNIYNQSGDTIKTIELSGFLLKAQKIEDNATSIIEIVDNVLKLLPNNSYILERALILSKKIEALLKIGNYDELINITRNEIIPVFEENLAKNKANRRYSHEFLFNTWLKISIYQANALSLQGNDKNLDVISSIEEVLTAYAQLDTSKYTQKLEIAKALAYTTKGQIDLSNEILNSIDNNSETLSEKDISFKNLIKIINKFLKFDYVNIKDELFECAIFANNCNDLVTKNIAKTLLAKLIKEDGNAQKALEIYNEQVSYFAENKISYGAFLNWLYMSEVYLLTDGPDKALEIAMKALEIAKTPKIMNINFIILLKKFIAELYLIKHDFDAVKMYIEKALLLSKKYGLDYMCMLLYNLYAKYFEEIITSKTSTDVQNVQNAFSMYEKSANIARELNIDNYITNIENAKQSLQVFCQLNNISID